MHGEGRFDEQKELGKLWQGGNHGFNRDQRPGNQTMRTRPFNWSMD